MSMKNKTKRVPKFKSSEDEERYWETHSLTEHLGEFKPAKVRFVRPLKHMISIRLDLDLFEKIRRLAEHKATPYQTLMQQWLAERVAEEFPALPAPSAYASLLALGAGR